MVEPNEPIKALIIPNTGDLPGAWGTAAVNPNFTAIGAMLGGFQTISLSAATTIALTSPAGSITPGAGPTQQQNAMLRFTGTQLGTATLQFSYPGYYIVDNQCAGTSFPLVFAPATGTGSSIGIPPGRKTHVFFDGTSMDYVSEPIPGSAIDLHGVTAAPAWMLAGTTPYALVKDGSVHTSALFPTLAAQLGSTFGGNGVTTFGVPDERSRMRLAVDTGATNRVTAGGSGINGTTMGATGGNELMQSHNHGLTDPGHSHGASSNIPGLGTPGGFNGGNAGSFGPVTQTITVTTSTTGITISSAGSGGSQNMPPTIVSFLALIKT